MTSDILIVLYGRLGLLMFFEPLCKCFGGFLLYILHLNSINPSLNRNVGKYHLSHIGDEILFNTSELKIIDLWLHHLPMVITSTSHPPCNGHSICNLVITSAIFKCCNIQLMWLTICHKYKNGNNICHLDVIQVITSASLVYQLPQQYMAITSAKT